MVSLHKRDANAVSHLFKYRNNSNKSAMYIHPANLPSSLMIVLRTSVEMNTARVPVFARVVLKISNTVGGVSMLDGIECRTFDPSFPEKTIS